MRPSKEKQILVLVEIRLQRQKKETGLQTLLWTLSQQVFVAFSHQNTLKDDWNPQKETQRKQNGENLPP